MTCHVTVKRDRYRRFGPRLWRAECSCGYYARSRYWSSVMHLADAHTHP